MAVRFGRRGALIAAVCAFSVMPAAAAQPAAFNGVVATPYPSEGRCVVSFQGTHQLVYNTDIGLLSQAGWLAGGLQAVSELRQRAPKVWERYARAAAHWESQAPGDRVEADEFEQAQQELSRLAAQAGYSILDVPQIITAAYLAAVPGQLASTYPFPDFEHYDAVGLVDQVIVTRDNRDVLAAQIAGPQTTPLVIGLQRLHYPPTEIPTTWEDGSVLPAGEQTSVDEDWVAVSLEVSGKRARSKLTRLAHPYLHEQAARFGVVRPLSLRDGFSLQRENARAIGDCIRLVDQFPAAPSPSPPEELPQHPRLVEIILDRATANLVLQPDPVQPPNSTTPTTPAPPTITPPTGGRSANSSLEVGIPLLLALLGMLAAALRLIPLPR